MIKSVEFINYRNLNQKFEFNNTLNIIFGNNNFGKTNLLDGIRLAFSTITNDYFKISKSDFKNSDDTVPINIKVELEVDSIPSLNFFDENGKIKKVDIDDLRKIAETLDMSLQKLLKVAGYDEMLFYFSKDKYANKSSKDLKEMIKNYEESQRNLLDFDTEKRKKVSDARQKLFYTIEHLQIMKDNKDSLYTVDKAIENIQYAFDELEFAEHKYNYEKLPKKN